MCGGKEITAYVPDVGVKETVRNQDESPVWKLRYLFHFQIIYILYAYRLAAPSYSGLGYFRYTSNGSLLYSACDDGKLRRYRRYPDHHEYLGEVYAHKGDIQDLDISPYDECILFICLLNYFSYR